MNPYSEIFAELEGGLWEHDLRVDQGVAPPYRYNNQDLRACSKIFMGAFMWKLWEHTAELPIEQRAAFAEEAGNRFRALILEFTGVDCHGLYSEGLK